MPDFDWSKRAKSSGHKGNITLSRLKIVPSLIMGFQRGQINVWVDLFYEFRLTRRNSIYNLQRVVTVCSQLNR